MKREWKINDIEITLELKYETVNQMDHITLENVKEAYILSICGSLYKSGKRHADKNLISSGQCLKEVYIASMDNKYTDKEKALIEKIYNLWSEYHCNDLMAGTDNQMEILKDFNGDFKEDCEFLKSNGLYEDRGYRYGSRWLIKQIPADVLAEIKVL